MSQSKLQFLYVKHYIRCSSRFGVGIVLFLLYINDMYRSSNEIRFVHIADDTRVFAYDSDSNNVYTTVIRELVYRS